MKSFNNMKRLAYLKNVINKTNSLLRKDAEIYDNEFALYECDEDGYAMEIRDIRTEPSEITGTIANAPVNPDASMYLDIDEYYERGASAYEAAKDALNLMKEYLHNLALNEALGPKMVAAYENSIYTVVEELAEGIVDSDIEEVPTLAGDYINAVHVLTEDGIDVFLDLETLYNSNTEEQVAYVNATVSRERALQEAAFDDIKGYIKPLIIPNDIAEKLLQSSSNIVSDYCITESGLPGMNVVFAYHKDGYMKVLTNADLAHFEKTPSDLYIAAVSNLHKLPYTFKRLCDATVGADLGNPDDHYIVYTETIDNWSFDSGKNCYGASVLLDPIVMERVVPNDGESYVLIPTSRNEVVISKLSPDFTLETAHEALRQANLGCNEGNFLTNDVLAYDRYSRSIVKADDLYLEHGGDYEEKYEEERN